MGAAPGRAHRCTERAPRRPALPGRCATTPRAVGVAARACSRLCPYRRPRQGQARLPHRLRTEFGVPTRTLPRRSGPQARQGARRLAQAARHEGRTGSAAGCPHRRTSRPAGRPEPSQTPR
eukprot:scaffold5213_cov113-Isochrysis_galbana.AAC.7